MPLNSLVCAAIGMCSGLVAAASVLRGRTSTTAANTSSDEAEEAAACPVDEKTLLKATDRAEEVVKLLITGYGPFRGYPTENPSTLTARHLDKLVLRSPATSTRPARRTEITFLPVSVTYAAIDTVIRPLHAGRKYDAYVHVGVASGATDGLRVERRARRGTYDSVDSEKQYCAEDAEGRRTVPNWRSEKQELWSSLEVKELLQFLREDKDVEHVRLSDDAGLYLCEYIYATSLNASQLSTSVSYPSKAPTPILFIHVPNLRPPHHPYSPGEPVYTELEVADILKLICGWVGDRA